MQHPAPACWPLRPGLLLLLLLLSQLLAPVRRLPPLLPLRGLVLLLSVGGVQEVPGCCRVLRCDACGPCQPVVQR